MGTRIMNTILLLLFVPIGLLFAQDAKADPLQDYFANAIAVAQESLDQQEEAEELAELAHNYCWRSGFSGSSYRDCVGSIIESN